MSLWGLGSSTKPNPSKPGGAGAGTGVQQLSAELGAIGTEATKKRLAPLREVVDRAQGVLSESMAAADSSSASSAAAGEHVWYAFAMGAKAFAPNHALVATCCQNLGKASSLGFVPVAQVPMATQMLADIVVTSSPPTPSAAPPAATPPDVTTMGAAGHADDSASTTQGDLQVEMRVLQAVGQLATTAERHPAMLQEALSLLHHLHVRSQHPSIRNASGAAAAQVGASVLQHLLPVAAEAEAGRSPLRKAAADRVHDLAAASGYLVDCLRLATGRAPLWLLPHAGIPAARTEAHAHAALVTLGITQEFFATGADALLSAGGGATTTFEALASVLREAVPDLVAHVPARPPSGAGPQAVDLFVSLHRLLVQITARLHTLCHPSALREILAFEAGVILRGRGLDVINHSASVAATAGDDIAASMMSQDTNAGSETPPPAESLADAAYVPTDAVANAVGAVVTVWRRALASPELIAALAEAELAASEELRALAVAGTATDGGASSSPTATITVDPVDVAPSMERLSTLRTGTLHERTASELSEDAEHRDHHLLHAAASPGGVGQRHQQRVRAFAALWERTPLVLLLQAPAVVLEAALLERQRQRTMRFVDDNLDDDLLGAPPGGAESPLAGNAAALGGGGETRVVWTPVFVGCLLDYCTLVAQSTARWLETLRQRREHAAAANHVTPESHSQLPVGAVVAVGTHTFLGVWPPLFSSASLALSLIGTDDVLHTTLKLLQHLVQCAGIAGVASARDSVLKQLSDCTQRCSEAIATALRAIPSGGGNTNNDVNTSTTPGRPSPSAGGPISPPSAHPPSSTTTGNGVAGDPESNAATSPAATAARRRRAQAAAGLHRQLPVVNTIVSIASGMANELGQGWSAVVEALVDAYEHLDDATATRCGVSIHDVEPVRLAIAHVFSEAASRFSDGTLTTVSTCLAAIGVDFTETHNAGTPGSPSNLSMTSPLQAQARGDVDADFASPVAGPLRSESPGLGTVSPQQQHSDPLNMTPDSRGATPGSRQAAVGGRPAAAKLYLSCRSPGQIAFVCQCFRGLLLAVSAPSSSSSSSEQAGISNAARRMAHLVWPGIREFITVACASTDLTPACIADVLDLTSAVVAAANPFVIGATAADDDAAVASARFVVDAASALILDTYTRSDSTFSANAACSPTAARALIIKQCIKIVQTHCDALATAASWRDVFRLAELTTTGSPAEVLLGYRIPELARSNAGAALNDPATAAAFIACTGAFVRQRAAPDRITLNLSAVQLLWSFADVLTGLLSPDAGTGRSATVDGAWNALVLKLRDGADDGRIEVLHSCVRTLFSLLVSHADHIPGSSWRIVVWDVLMPLVADHVVAPRSATGGGTTSKQLDEVAQSVLEGTSRVLRVSHFAIASGVPDGSDAVDMLLTKCYACFGGSSEHVVTAAAKAVAGIASDLLPYPAIASARALEHAFQAFERVVELANQQHGEPAAASASLACMKVVIDGAVDALFAARRRGPSGGWTDATGTAFVHRTIALLGRAATAHSVANTYMHPSSAHASLLAAVTRLAAEWHPTAAAAYGDDDDHDDELSRSASVGAAKSSGSAKNNTADEEALWGALLELLLDQLPNTNEIADAVDAGRARSLPKAKHPHYVAAVLAYVHEKFLPLAREAGRTVPRDLAAQLLTAALRVSAMGYIPGTFIATSGGDDDVTFDDGSSEGRVAGAALRCAGVIWKGIAASASSANEPPVAVAVTMASKALERSLSYAAESGQTSSLPTTGGGGGGDRLALLLVTDIAAPMVALLKRATAKKGQEALSTLLHCLLPISALPPSVAPQATGAACDLLFSLANDAPSTEAEDNVAPNIALEAAETALTDRAVVLLSNYAEDPADVAGAMADPVRQTLQWIAVTPSESPVALRRMTSLAPHVVALIGQDGGDAALQGAVRAAMGASIRILSAAANASMGAE